jgi:tetratricopeptide (TPR) repeat protein
MRQGNWYNLLSAREDGWTAAVTMIKTSPLLGVGAGQFSREFYPARMAWLDDNQELGQRGELATHFEWAHNDPLQLTSELGLIGGLWLILFVGARARSKPDAVMILAALTWSPFLLLHYPTHLAIGLIPGVLVLAHSLGQMPRTAIGSDSPMLNRGMTLIIGAVAVSIVMMEVSDFRLDRWRGRTEALMTTAEKAPPALRRQILRKVETEAGAKIEQSATSAPWLWRIVGRARLLEGASSQAEAAFRRSLALEPHEEAEMGLGLALAGQGRTTEAVHFLMRACRVNPALIVFIPDENLKKSVRKKMHR